jgi:hypothetical protein
METATKMETAVPDTADSHQKQVFDETCIN